MAGPTTARPASRWWAPPRITQVIAVALYAIAGILLAVLPLVATAENDGPTQSVRIGDVAGWGLVALLGLVPMALAAAPLPLQGRPYAVVTTVVAVLAGVGTFLAMLSIGVLYLPGTMALALAAFLRYGQERQARERAQR